MYSDIDFGQFIASVLAPILHNFLFIEGIASLRYESTTLTKLIPVTLVVLLTFCLREEPNTKYSRVGTLHCRDLTRDLPTKSFTTRWT